ncbi:MAG TPA: hypothetical protein VKT71_08375, partial [Candidatus Acidoferrales bacterium]|nr:hypothetical protein [Candidatus Acidoferrales bacterium]
MLSWTKKFHSCAIRGLASKSWSNFSPRQLWPAVDVVHFRALNAGRQRMKASLWYRIASVLLVLFALGHTLGFRQTDPEWGVGSLIDSMRTIHFNAQGFNRTYWDFFSAFGLFFSVFLLFAAVVAWQLSSFPAEILLRLRSISWALAVCFTAITILSWIYAF